jgi:hypothetical protein
VLQTQTILKSNKNNKKEKQGMLNYHQAISIVVEKYHSNFQTRLSRERDEKRTKDERDLPNNMWITLRDQIRAKTNEEEKKEMQQREAAGKYQGWNKEKYGKQPELDQKDLCNFFLWGKEHNGELRPKIAVMLLANQEFIEAFPEFKDLTTEEILDYRLTDITKETTDNIQTFFNREIEKITVEKKETATTPIENSRTVTTPTTDSVSNNAALKSTADSKKEEDNKTTVSSSSVSNGSASFPTLLSFFGSSHLHSSPRRKHKELVKQQAESEDKKSSKKADKKTPKRQRL